MKKEQEGEKTKYFRPHRSLYKDSMAERYEVRCVKDITETENNKMRKMFNFNCDYLRNVRILPQPHEHRGKGDDWGDETYYVVADFDSFTGQCIGFSNFYE